MEITKKTNLLCLKDVVAEQVEFLWEPYIPIGKVTIVSGNPGVGKSFFTLALAASLSKWGRLSRSEESEAGTYNFI